MAKKFFTVAEAAREKGVSREAVHLAIKKGLLNHEWVTVERVIKKRIRVCLCSPCGNTVACKYWGELPIWFRLTCVIGL